MHPPGVVVVGTDGSEEARLALWFGAREAAWLGATLRVVSAFESPKILADRYGLPMPPIPVTKVHIAKRVETAVREMIDEVLGDMPAPPMVEVVVRAGSPVLILVEESASADLLVVGHRGLGRMASVIHGSVGVQCVLHARCTVAVVRSSAKHDEVVRTTVADRHTSGTGPPAKVPDKGS